MSWKDIKFNLKNFWEELNTPRNDVLHLNIFWRIALFPLIIWWFVFQTVFFSLLLGTGLIIVVGAAAVITLGTKENLEAVDLLLLPIIAPFVWLYRYFVLGEFCTLFEEDIWN